MFILYSLSCYLNRHLDSLLPNEMQDVLDRFVRDCPSDSKPKKPQLRKESHNSERKMMRRRPCENANIYLEDFFNCGRDMVELVVPPSSSLVPLPPSSASPQTPLWTTTTFGTREPTLSLERPGRDNYVVTTHRTSCAFAQSPWWVGSWSHSPCGA